MRRLLAVLVLAGCISPLLAGPIDLFLHRVQNGRVRFLGFDPARLGDANRATTLAYVVDSDGSLGQVTVQSPGFWRNFAKGSISAVAGASGAFFGALAGAPVLGVGAIPGAIIGGTSAYITTAGTLILANSGRSNPFICQDIAIFDQLTIKKPSGETIDLLAAIIAEVGSGATQHVLPGGAVLLRPNATLFANGYLGPPQAPLRSGEVEVAVLDIDGNLTTISDRVVAVFYQDLIHGIRVSHEAGVPLDGVVDAALLTHGDKILSRQIFAITSVDGFSATATVAPHSVSRNDAAVVTAAVANTTEYSLDGLIIDIEIFGPTGVRVHQDVFRGQEIPAGASRNFATLWSPNATGSYTVKVGVFNNDWTVQYYWQDKALSVAVSDTLLRVEWPAEGATLAMRDFADGRRFRKHQFAASLVGRAPDSYSIHWYVDGDRGNVHSMQNAPGGRFKLDTSGFTAEGWTWKNNGAGMPFGPFVVTFVATEAFTGISTERNVTVYISPEQ